MHTFEKLEKSLRMHFAFLRKGCKRSPQEVAQLPSTVVAKRQRVAADASSKGLLEAQHFLEEGSGLAPNVQTMYIYIYAHIFVHAAHEQQDATTLEVYIYIIIYIHVCETCRMHAQTYQGKMIL